MAAYPRSTRHSGGLQLVLLVTTAVLLSWLTEHHVESKAVLAGNWRRARRSLKTGGAAGCIDEDSGGVLRAHGETWTVTACTQITCEDNGHLSAITCPTYRYTWYDVVTDGRCYQKSVETPHTAFPHCCPQELCPGDPGYNMREYELSSLTHYQLRITSNQQ